MAALKQMMAASRPSSDKQDGQVDSDEPTTTESKKAFVLATSVAATEDRHVRFEDDSKCSHVQDSSICLNPTNTAGRSLPANSYPLLLNKRSHSLPMFLPEDHRLLKVRSKRSPSADVIQREFRYATLRKVVKEGRDPPGKRHQRRSSDYMLDRNVYQLVLQRSRRSPSANAIQKEFRHVSLRKTTATKPTTSIRLTDNKVDPSHSRRRPEPSLMVSSRSATTTSLVARQFLEDSDNDVVYELVQAHSRRSPSANIIKKEYRYARLRNTDHRSGTVTPSKSANRTVVDATDDDARSLSSLSTIISTFRLDRTEDYDDDENEDDNNDYYLFDWLEDLDQPMMALPTMFPYYESSGWSNGGQRRMSGSTTATPQSENSNVT